ncbi:hypothetical protein VSS74_15945 [Conexibacter stalactiti]|uniref:Adenylate cyclase n=1 Tax=Conexibacter stalactiti TaxID=1940611 RepID=A0ABU4HRC4_9ACTN|nr:hypothetical protein [Conexibacter stalactiti]MDW5595841.1 hypothetical protein [Conexibacter stalactiti]MEC5036483.1 hypothetical protein [Conexibacter stalactiti]
MLLTDAEIARLIDERKPALDAVAFLHAFARSAPVRGHRRTTRSVVGESGSRFDVHLRQGVFSPYDFSVILAYLPPHGTELILRRHNGRGHPHRNKLERDTVDRDAFHIHFATERYQLAGLSIDGFAEPTTAFSDLATALDAMLVAGGFEPPPQRSLWP